MVFIRPALGLLQGLVTYWLLKYTQFSVASTTCAVIVMTFPLFALQVKLPDKNTLKLGLGLLAVMALIYGYASYSLMSAFTTFDTYITLSLTAQCILSAFIFFIFYCVVIEERRFTFPYATLFSEAWQVILKIMLGNILVVLTLSLCWLAAMMFEFLNISFIHDLVSSKLFFYTAPPLFFGIAMTILHQHEEIITRSRNILLAFCKFLYPLFVVISLSFLVVVPFANKPFANFWEIIILLSILNIIFFNGVFQAGWEKAPYSRWIGIPIYILMIVICLYSLYVFKYPVEAIRDHGMKPDEFLLLTLLMILALYHLCYSLAIFFSREPWLSMIKPINMILALLVATLYLAMALPWFKVVFVAY